MKQTPSVRLRSRLRQLFASAFGRGGVRFGQTVAIDQPTAAITISSNVTVSISSVYSSESLSFTGGELTVASTATVAGNVSINGGRLNDGTWCSTGRFSANASANNRLTDVAVDGDINFSATSSRIDIYGTTSWNTLSLIENLALLQFEPGASILGDITVGSAANYMTLGVVGNGTVTVAPGVTINKSGTGQFDLGAASLTAGFPKTLSVSDFFQAESARNQTCDWSRTSFEGFEPVAVSSTPASRLFDLHPCHSQPPFIQRTMQ